MNTETPDEALQLADGHAHMDRACLPDTKEIEQMAEWLDAWTLPEHHKAASWLRMLSEQNAGLQRLIEAVGAGGVGPLMQAANSTKIPEGWKLVPVMPTIPMLHRADGLTCIDFAALGREGAFDLDELKEIYRSMLAAAPQPPDQDGWQKLAKPARVGGGTFGIGTSAKNVVLAAQRAHEEHVRIGALTHEQMVEEERRRRHVWDMIHGLVDVSPQPPAVEQHTDDAAVGRFAEAMKAKLAVARSKGRGGWDDPEQCTVEYLAKLLVDHVAKGDPVDVANLAMMLHQRQADKCILSAAAPQPPAVEQEPVAWQCRMRADWGRSNEWWPWQECSQEKAEDYKRVPYLNNWHYESRSLYTRPQPKRKPMTDDEHERLMRGRSTLDYGRAIERAHGIGGEA